MEDKNNLTTTTTTLVDTLANETDVENIKDTLKLFNLNMAQKSAIRMVKLNELLDKVNDQAIERFEKRPDQISNKDLLTFMSTVQTQLEKSSAMVNSIDSLPTIQINNQHNEINVNVDGPTLTKEQRDRVISVLELITSDSDIIDVTPHSSNENDNVDKN